MNKLIYGLTMAVICLLCTSCRDKVGDNKYTIEQIFNLNPMDRPILLNPNGCSTCKDTLFNHLDSLINIKPNLKVIIMSDRNKETQNKLGNLAINPDVIYDTNKDVISNNIAKNNDEIVLFINNEKYVFTYMEYSKVLHLLNFAF